jgi:hypothetical protein
MEEKISVLDAELATDSRSSPCGLRHPSRRSAQPIRNGAALPPRCNRHHIANTLAQPAVLAVTLQRLAALLGQGARVANRLLSRRIRASGTPARAKRLLHPCTTCWTKPACDKTLHRTLW